MKKKIIFLIIIFSQLLVLTLSQNVCKLTIERLDYNYGILLDRRDSEVSFHHISEILMWL